jgi:hypothetical protein
MVPLVAAKRDYAVLPDTGGSGPAGGIGMDDPLLAPHLTRTALDPAACSPPEALTYRVTAEREGGDGADLPGEAGAVPGTRTEATGPVDIILQSAGSSEAKAGTRNPLRELLITTLLTTVGLAAAYHLSQDHGLDPQIWVGAGGLWGLILGWLCIKWMRQRQ